MTQRPTQVPQCPAASAGSSGRDVEIITCLPNRRSETREPAGFEVLGDQIVPWECVAGAWNLDLGSIYPGLISNSSSVCSLCRISRVIGSGLHCMEHAVLCTLPKLTSGVRTGENRSFILVLVWRFCRLTVDCSLKKVCIGSPVRDFEQLPPGTCPLASPSAAKTPQKSTRFGPLSWAGTVAN
jgi:hypothetical protein